MALTYPMINGLRYDFASAEFSIAAVPFFNGVKEINYKDSLEPGELRGNRAQVIGRTRGKYSAEANITLYKQEFHTLMAALLAQGTASGGLGAGEVSFDIACAYSEVGEGVIVDKLVGCRLKSPDQTHQEGGDALTVKLDLHLLYILHNGIPLVGALKLLK